MSANAKSGLLSNAFKSFKKVIDFHDSGLKIIEQIIYFRHHLFVQEFYFVKEVQVDSR